MGDTEREDPEGAIRHWDDAMERDAQRWRKLCRLMNAGCVSLRITRLAGDDQFCNSSQSMTAAIDRELEKP